MALPVPICGGGTDCGTAFDATLTNYGGNLGSAAEPVRADLGSIGLRVHVSGGMLVV